MSFNNSEDSMLLVLHVYQYNKHFIWALDLLSNKAWDIIKLVTIIKKL